MNDKARTRKNKTEFEKAVQKKELQQDGANSFLLRTQTQNPEFPATDSHFFDCVMVQLFKRGQPEVHGRSMWLLSLKHCAVLQEELD